MHQPLFPVCEQLSDPEIEGGCGTGVAVGGIGVGGIAVGGIGVGGIAVGGIGVGGIWVGVDSIGGVSLQAFHATQHRLFGGPHPHHADTAQHCSGSCAATGVAVRIGNNQIITAIISAMNTRWGLIALASNALMHLNKLDWIFMTMLSLSGAMLL